MNNDIINEELNLIEQESVTGGGLADLWNAAVRAVAQHILNNKLENMEKVNYMDELKKKGETHIALINPMPKCF